MESVQLVQVKDRPFFSAVGQKVWLLCKASQEAVEKQTDLCYNLI